MLGSNLFDLTGKIAVVTGGSSGLGQGAASVLAANGVQVLVIARREDKLNEWSQSAKGETAVLAADLSDRSALANIAAEAVRPFGTPDILINAAGINTRQPADEMTDAHWDLTQNLNVAAPFFLAKAMVPGMRAKGWGRIINFASLQSRRAFANGISYGASKGAVEQMTRAMAEAWSRDGITANAIAPGFFRTELTEQVFSDPELFDNYEYSPGQDIYLAGDIKKIQDKWQLYPSFSDSDSYDSDSSVDKLPKSEKVFIIKELSTNYQDWCGSLKPITIGEVPINIYNVGIYFKHFFTSEKDYYSNIVDEHEFQSLTESNKEGKANRKGIYLTTVVPWLTQITLGSVKEEIKFKLLRCSTNLSGPTDNFRGTDYEIIDKVNKVTRGFFTDENVDLNHVLAQTYHNTKNVNVTKDKKAKIREHSDKTKDMPKNALMAFCTFYKDYSGDDFTDSSLKYEKTDNDYLYKGKTTILTKLRFRLKK